MTTKKIQPRIALIHATIASRQPIFDAMLALWPEADLVSLLEESLSTDRARQTDLDPIFFERMDRLAAYGKLVGAQGVLFTCSAFGEPIEAAQRKYDFPILKPNEAMFERALEAGRRIALIYTFEPAGKSMEAEFLNDAHRANRDVSIDLFFAEGALEALNEGDGDKHDEIIAGIAEKLSDYDAIMLAQFSMARAAPYVRGHTSIPVLTSPDLAVEKMKSLVGFKQEETCFSE